MRDDVTADACLHEKLTQDFGYYLDCVVVLATAQSAYQHIQILQTATFGTVLRLDGALQCSERDEFFYHEPLVHMAMAHSHFAQHVLIVGGGDGGAAEEALKWPSVRHLDHIEIDPLVLDLCQKHLGTVHRGVLSGADPRYHQHVGDGAEHMATAARKGHTYDTIILDLTDAGGPSSALYGDDFYRQCSQVLAPLGVLTLHVAAPWAQQAACLATVARLRTAFTLVEPFVVSVPLSGGQWLMAACHNQLRPLHSQSARLQRPLAQLRGPALKVVDASSLSAMLHLPPYLAHAMGAAQ
jgi:spermidine synthase